MNDAAGHEMGRANSLGSLCVTQGSTSITLVSKYALDNAMITLSGEKPMIHKRNKSASIQRYQNLSNALISVRTAASGTVVQW